ncbi:MAG: reverse transcriptase domain-containing protein, partial [Saprospiraceae bacterium]|nr:reverse transcriptase domain-containing protein [Saprospiraceae bacterium]
MTEEHSIPEFSTLLEQVVERDNMIKAYRRVRQNRGAAGIDGMTVEELHDFLQRNWPGIKAQLLSGTYIPQPVRRVEIPKPGGGTRALGVPTVLDRLIQQAVLQKLSPLFDPEFSEHSYGFRPGRSAQQAVLQARRYQQAGKRWVVDMDLEKFFDEVNHDILMARVSRKVRDRKLLHLIRLYLQSGVMIGGL